jgi:hypothetical protein
MWISEKVRQLAAGAALARIANYKPVPDEVERRS